MDIIEAIWEYNEAGGILFADAYPGVYGRGKTIAEAEKKLRNDLSRYVTWAALSLNIDVHTCPIHIIEEKQSTLEVHQADTDILFESEKKPISLEEYEQLKYLVMKSAQDFVALYKSIPVKIFTDIKSTTTFYGAVPRTAKEMLAHTNSVTNYYLHEIHIIFENLDDMIENRIQAFKELEAKTDFLNNQIYIGQYQEAWNLRKVLRRFLWHDSIHAKAMYRLGIRNWSKTMVHDTFGFEVSDVTR